MSNFGELENITEEIFSQERTIAEPPAEWKRKLEVLAGKENELITAIFEMRCKQAKVLGFQKVEVAELVKKLTGEAHTEKVTSKEKENVGYVFNHHNGDVSSNWTGNYSDYKHRWQPHWWLPPFCKSTKWVVRDSRVELVKKKMTTKVAFRLEVAKKLKLFNAFSVVGFLEAFEKEESKAKVIVLGGIWEVQKTKKDSYTSGSEELYFLAEW